jgi:hypothetical protein
LGAVEGGAMEKPENSEFFVDFDLIFLVADCHSEFVSQSNPLAVAFG